MEDVKVIDAKSIIKFWNWFQTISEDLLNYNTRRDLTNEIDSLISSQWGFDWEIGPYDNEKIFFCISPGLDVECLETTKRIISLAPDCKGWVFLPSKPVKDWKGVWETKNLIGRKILIDTNNWEYVLYGFEDGTYEIDILITETADNIGLYEEAVDIALTGYLGEEDYMRLITHVDIVDEFGDDVISKATKLKFIKQHIESL